MARRGGPISVNMRGYDRVSNTIGKWPIQIKKEVKKAIQKVALIDIETKAKVKLTHDGHVDTGRLKTSIHTEYEGSTRILPGRISDIGAIVGTNVFYAPFIEKIDPYVTWAYKKALPILDREIQAAIRRAIS